jgi:hypothetical protein
MPTDPELSKLAATLSEAQRRCFNWACSFLPGCAPTEGEGVEQFCDDVEPTDTINQCFDLGILDQRGSGCFDDFRIVVTPLGIALRNHLTKETPRAE